jgi:transcriptional regulator with XRE-family HTH domain
MRSVASIIDTTDRQAFGHNLRDARLNLGWRQEDLARVTGIGRTTIIRWENGQTYPSPRMLKHVAQALGVSIPALRSHRRLIADAGSNSAHSERHGENGQHGEGIG